MDVAHGVSAQSDVNAPVQSIRKQHRCCSGVEALIIPHLSEARSDASTSASTAAASEPQPHSELKEDCNGLATPSLSQVHCEGSQRCATQQLASRLEALESQCDMLIKERCGDQYRIACLLEELKQSRRAAEVATAAASAAMSAASTAAGAAQRPTLGMPRGLHRHVRSLLQVPTLDKRSCTRLGSIVGHSLPLALPAQPEPREPSIPQPAPCNRHECSDLRDDVLLIATSDINQKLMHLRIPMQKPIIPSLCAMASDKGSWLEGGHDNCCANRTFLGARLVSTAGNNQTTFAIPPLPLDSESCPQHLPLAIPGELELAAAEPQHTVQEREVEELLPAPLPDKACLSPSANEEEHQLQHQVESRPYVVEQTAEEQDEDDILEGEARPQPSELEKQEEDMEMGEKENARHEVQDMEEKLVEEGQEDECGGNEEGTEEKQVLPCGILAFKTPPATHKLVHLLILRAMWHIHIRQRPQVGPWFHILRSAVTALKRAA